MPFPPKPPDPTPHPGPPDPTPHPGSPQPGPHPPGPPHPGGGGGKPSDGAVSGYKRIVDGKVIEVGAYAKSSTPATSAMKKAWSMPGRPQINANPGSYSGGRDIPGMDAFIGKEPPKKPPPQFMPGLPGHPPVQIPHQPPPPPQIPPKKA